MAHGEDDRIPPRTLVMDVTMTHDHYGRTTEHTYGALTHRVSSTGGPQTDGALNKAARMKIRYYRQIYADRPDSIVFLPLFPSICLRGLSYLYLTYSTLVECLLFLINLWS